MARSRSTRLRYVRSKDPELAEAAIESMPVRVQIYSIYFAKGKHYIWFVADEGNTDGLNITSEDLDE